MNYLALASWIANLGVVPLLRFAAFLFAPAALDFALRRFSVTAVLEAINISSRNYLISNFKHLNLNLTLLFVKALLVLPCASFAISPSSSDYIIAHGEQKEIILSGLKRYSVGNPAIISYKLLEKEQKLLIKGKKIGFTDILVWTSKGKQTLGVYVLSKQKFLKTFQLGEALKNLGLDIQVKGPIITASGTVSEFSDYLYLQKLKAQYADQIFLKVSLSRELRNFIIGKIYKTLFSSEFPIITCQSNELDVLCFHEGESNSPLLKELGSYYKVTFIKQDSRIRKTNYRVRLKIVQLEKIDGTEIHTGLDKLQTSLHDLFDFGVRKLIEDNLIYFSKTKLDLSTLAEPESILSTNHELKIEIGSEIPFQNIKQENTHVIAPIDWKFAGLRIIAKLSEVEGKLFLKYETEFSRPVHETISGSKENSSLFLEVGEPVKIFQIGFQTTSKMNKGIPGLMDVPILKSLFGSKSNQNTYKQLYGYIVLEEEK